MIGEEKRFFHSLQDSKIIQGSLDDLKNVLKIVMVKVGLRSQNWPEEEEKAILIAHIIKEFGNHTIEEIKLAFDLLISGKLFFEDPKEAKCYENFSCLYFSTIMNSYRIWASEVHKQHISSMDNLQIEYREDTSDAAMNDWMQHIREIKAKLEFMPITLYDWLDRKMIIQKTNDQKREYLQKAVNYRQSQLAKSFAEDSRNLKELQAFNEMKAKGCFEGAEISKLKDLAKKMILFDYLFQDGRN